MLSRKGMTFIEIMLAVFIMALAIVPISRMLSGVSGTTKADRCEAEAMQFASDLMDNILMKMEFDPAAIASPAWQISDRGDTNIRYQVITRPVAWASINTPVIRYHPPCANGVEVLPLAQLESDILTENRDLATLDKETVDRLGLDPTGNDFDLCDIKLIVDWKPKGTPDSEFLKRPIILISRKARL